MPKPKIIAIICMCLFLMLFYGCSKSMNEVSNNAETEDSSTHVHEQGEQAGHEHEGEQAGHEHEGEAGHEHGEEGEHVHSEEAEESGVHLAPDEIYDEVRKGVRMVLSYEKDSDSFIGTVENTTDKAIQRVRVEVHLSNGTELGPTKALELAAGKIVDIKLSAEGQSFEWWTAHAESGASEH